MPSVGSFWKATWRFIKPEIEETIVYILIVIGFAATAFYQTVINDARTSSNDISSSFAVIQDKFTFLTNGDDTVAKFFTFGLWFVIGTFVYALAWFLIYFSSNAFHDVEVSNNFVHPSTFKKSDFWLSVGARLLLRSAAAISLLIYISLWCAAIAPAWLASFREMVISGVTTDTGSDIVLAIIGIGFSLHIAAILLRIVLLRAKYSYER